MSEKPCFLTTIDLVKVMSLDTSYENKVFSFTVHFNLKRTDMKWQVTHSFARFKVLEMMVRKFAPKYIYSRFPGSGSLSSLRLRLSSKAVEHRRLMLDIWIREVVANGALFPDNIQSNLWDFMKIPVHKIPPKALTPTLTTVKSKASLSRTLSMRVSPKGNITDIMDDQSRIRLKSIIQPTTTTSTTILPSLPHKKSILERVVRSLRKILRIICMKAINSLSAMISSSDQEGVSIVCLGRNERLLVASSDTLNNAWDALYHRRNSNGSSLLFMHGLMFVHIAMGVMLLDYIFGKAICRHYGICMTNTGLVLCTSLIMYFQLLCLDYDGRDNEVSMNQSSCIKVQETLRVFLDAPLLEYTDEARPFPSLDDSDAGNSEHSDFSEEVMMPDVQVAGSGSMHALFRRRHNHRETSATPPLPGLSQGKAKGPGLGPNAVSIAAATAASFSSGTAIAAATASSSSSNGLNTASDASVTMALGGSKGVFGTSNAKKLPCKLHEALVPGSTVDNCEWTDVSKEARAMYTCRATTHPMKVRGETYMEDQKKIAPGAAMSKLMLLELYEVEAKDENQRHDHIVSRGKAKQRLEALRTLPEHLFFIVLNFQIPGDPPVSIVSYFAVPLDLMEKYPSRATAKFLDMFEKFVDAPRTERQRLAAWGVTVPEEEEENEQHAHDEGDVGDAGSLNCPHRFSDALLDAKTAENTATNELAKGLQPSLVVPGPGRGNELYEKSKDDMDILRPLPITIGPKSTEFNEHKRASSVSPTASSSARASFLSPFKLSSPMSSPSSPSPSDSDAAPNTGGNTNTSGDRTHPHHSGGGGSNSNSTLSKIGRQGKKMVRGAAALGGGGLKRMSNFLTGNPQHQTQHHGANSSVSSSDSSNDGNKAATGLSSSEHHDHRSDGTIKTSNHAGGGSGGGSHSSSRNSRPRSHSDKGSRRDSLNEYGFSNENAPSQSPLLPSATAEGGSAAANSNHHHSNHHNNNHSNNHNNHSNNNQTRGDKDRRTRSFFVQPEQQADTGSQGGLPRSSSFDSHDSLKGMDVNLDLDLVRESNHGIEGDLTAEQQLQQQRDGRVRSVSYAAAPIATTTDEKTIITTGGEDRDKRTIASTSTINASASASASGSKSVGVGSKPTTPTASTEAKGWIPQDITWPTAYDVGALPQSDYRNDRFKLIPSITIGPWVVRAAVRATPAMLGKKVVQRYFRGDDYLEIDVHVGSSVIASNVVGLCRGYAKHIINDCGIVIQGEGPGELPERMLACAGLNHIDCNIRKKLD